ncbi:MAG: hypothetical protein EOP87_19250, partial [Verrucomicrobiaceae bacterium]
MSQTSPRPRGSSGIFFRRHLLPILCLSATTAVSHGQTFRVRGGVSLATVPTGTQATLNGPVVTSLAALPYAVSLNNPGAGRSGSTGGGITSFTSTVQTGNLSKEPFLAGGTSTSMDVYDQLSVTGSSWTGRIEIKIDFEITGSVTVNNAFYDPSVPSHLQSFDAYTALTIRLDGDPDTFEYSLRDLLGQGDSTPRTITGTFPVALTGSTRLSIASGRAFTTRITHSSSVDFDAQARITKISFVPPPFETGSITSPVIASFSGYDYNPLQNG